MRTVIVAQLIRYHLSVMANIQSQKRRACNTTTATRENHNSSPAPNQT